MLRNIFHYIYCMPISVTILIMISICFLWRYLEKNIVSQKRKVNWSYLNLTLFLMWLVGVIYMTILSRGEKNEIYLKPFHFIIQFLDTGNKEFFRVTWMNILLFVPGGLYLFYGLKTRNKKRAIIVSFFLLLFSICIETAQYFLKRGLTETDDVMFNFIGAIIGATSYHWVPKLRDKLIRFLKKI